MIKNKEQKRPGAVFVVILAVLVAWGCSSLNAKQLAKKQEIETGKWEFYWDEEWIKTGTLRWHEHQNSLYINEEKGWAEGTFGKVENCDSYYLLQPIYRFKVVGPDKVEKEIVVRMGYIEHERVFSASEYLEGCWSEKVTFEPGSRVLDETVIRDYEKDYEEIPSKCSRRSSYYDHYATRIPIQPSRHEEQSIE